MELLGFLIFAGGFYWGIRTQEMHKYKWKGWGTLCGIVMVAGLVITFFWKYIK